VYQNLYTCMAVVFLSTRNDICRTSLLVEIKWKKMPLSFYFDKMRTPCTSICFLPFWGKDVILTKSAFNMWMFMLF